MLEASEENRADAWLALSDVCGGGGGGAADGMGLSAVVPPQTLGRGCCT